MATTIALPALTLSVRDAAFELSCSEDLVRSLIARKQLRAHRVGSRILIRRDDLEQLLDATRI